MAETATQLDVEDDGSVTISGVEQVGVTRAKEWVEGLVKEVQAGEIYEGEVVRIQPFGAFIQILPGKDGLVHVSDMAEGFVQNPEDVVKMGDKVQVRVREVDALGRINLSMRMDPTTDKPREARSGGDRGGSRGGFGSRGGGRPSGGGFRRDDRRPSGPRTGGYDRGSRGRDDRRGRGEATSSPRYRSGEAGRSGSEGGPGGPHFPASRLVPSKRRF